MVEKDNEKKPLIACTRFSPYLAVDVDTIIGQDGIQIPKERVVALCRCGASHNKPYCDGQHAQVGFDGKRSGNSLNTAIKDYVGEKIIIHDNRAVCSHAAHCIEELPAVFRQGHKSWINPDGAPIEDIIRVIRMCPSGALTYTVDGTRNTDWGNPPKIEVEENGPYRIVGNIFLKDAEENVPAVAEHYTLCRCGASKNKPFCDGAHIKTNFKD